VNISIFLLGIIITSYFMVTAKRMSSLIGAFRGQSFFLFLATFSIAIKENSAELYVVSGLILLLKVVLIPKLLSGMIRKLKMDEGIGLFLNPLISLSSAVFLTYISYIFSTRIIVFRDMSQAFSFAVSLSVTLIGLFIMVFRMKALSQVMGFLVMENGLFLAASAVSGGMPFFAEIAIFMDVFVSVIIFGVFIYRINKLFTHIDASKLNTLKR
jgi:hydrogenase-4 component E